MIQAQNLTKHYGDKTAVSGATFTAQQGKVTGFLGPNGAGKSTTMRMAMGLDRPSEGSITINGKPLAEHKSPLREVGALLDARAAHPNRSAKAHLSAIAATHHIPKKRVDDVLELTGIAGVAHKPIKGYSLGMGQRLGIAVALLGDPETLIFDEPVNGLDPEGVKWVRQLCRALAAEGRTVFISSHLMSEMAQTADHLVVIGRGRIIADAPIEHLLNSTGENRVRVRTDAAESLVQALNGPGVTIVERDSSLLEVQGLTPRQIGQLALERQILLTELTPIAVTLEDAYLNITHSEVEYHSGDGLSPLTQDQPETVHAMEGK
ncbi:ABC transporter ATP-binding protein [Neomicrococcus lactis]